MKEEKGAITLFVLISCMFMVVILLVVNIGVMNKNRSQEKNLEEIAKQYNQNETDLDNAYAKVADENTYLTELQIEELIEEKIKTSRLETYPIGSIYITTNEQNPSEYLGGEWESYGEGRTIVGAGTGTDENNVKKVFEINQIGGEYQHTLTINEMPSHSHKSWSKRTNITVNSGGNTFLGCHNTSGGDSSPAGLLADYTGGSKAHNNIQPYIATYMWERIK